MCLDRLHLQLFNQTSKATSRYELSLDPMRQSHVCSLVQKVRARYDAKPAESLTLELLVQNEKGEKKRTATEGLMWLLRAMSFTCKALQNAQANKTEELATAFSNSYEGTLKKFHNFVVKGVFAVCPYDICADITAPAHSFSL